MHSIRRHRYRFACPLRLQRQGTRVDSNNTDIGAATAEPTTGKEPISPLPFIRWLRDRSPPHAPSYRCGNYITSRHRGASACRRATPHTMQGSYGAAPLARYRRRHGTTYCPFPGQSQSNATPYRNHLPPRRCCHSQRLLSFRVAKRVPNPKPTARKMETAT